MLVKFLSLIASVLGTDRYKPVVFSCLALLLASTGILAIVAFQQPPVAPAISQTTPAKSEEPKPQRQSNQLGVPKQQLPEGSSLQQETSNQGGTTVTPTPSAQADTAPEARTNTSSGATELVLSLNTISMSGGSTSGPISASSSDNSKLEWSIVAQSNESHLQVVTDPLKEVASSIRLRLRANNDTPAGTYSFLITAKDTAKSINLSKVLTVTVNP